MRSLCQHTPTVTCLQGVCYDALLLRTVDAAQSASLCPWHILQRLHKNPICFTVERLHLKPSQKYAWACLRAALALDQPARSITRNVSSHAAIHHPGCQRSLAYPLLQGPAQAALRRVSSLTIVASSKDHVATRSAWQICLLLLHHETDDSSRKCCLLNCAQGLCPRRLRSLPVILMLAQR